METIESIICHIKARLGKEKQHFLATSILAAKSRRFKGNSYFIFTIARIWHYCRQCVLQIYMNLHSFWNGREAPPLFIPHSEFVEKKMWKCFLMHIHTFQDPLCGCSPSHIHIRLERRLEAARGEEGNLHEICKKIANFVVTSIAKPNVNGPESVS